MAGKFAVIGLGHFGFAVAKKLADKGAEVLAIDKNMERVELLKDEVAYAVALDATDIKALNSQNVADMDAVLVAIGENIEGLLLTTVLLLEMGVKRLIARAISPQQRLILEKIGVKEIISPEEEVGWMVAEMLVNPSVSAFMKLPDNYEIAEIKTPKRIVKKSIGEIRLDTNYDLQLISIKRYYEEYIEGRQAMVQHLVRNFNHETLINATDTLIVMGRHQDIDKFITVNN
jgi:trk system potassium uptake protein